MPPFNKPMAKGMMADSAQPDMMDEAAPPSEEEGYCIEICVYPDGSLAVSKEPLSQEAEPQGGPETSPTESSAGETATAPAAEEEERFDTISDALKAALRIYRDNLLGATENEEIEAGYRAEGGGTPRAY